MRNMLVAITILGVSFASAACGGGDGPGSGQESAAASSAQTPPAASVLERGMAQQEVLDKLGEPRTRVTMGGGLERWTYYSYDEQGQIAAKTLIIFGEDGTVVEINDLSP